MEFGAAEATEQTARAIPDELKALPQWVCTKIVPGEKKNLKIPINAKTGQGASSTNPATWATYQEVEEMIAEWAGFDHTHVDKSTGAELTGPLVLPGFVLTGADPYFVVDLDHCIDGSGNLDPGHRCC
jgi:primase-polymerase (primpol)-like protein